MYVVGSARLVEIAKGVRSKDLSCVYIAESERFVGMQRWHSKDRKQRLEMLQKSCMNLREISS